MDSKSHLGRYKELSLLDCNDNNIIKVTQEGHKPNVFCWLFGWKNYKLDVYSPPGTIIGRIQRLVMLGDSLLHAHYNSHSNVVLKVTFLNIYIIPDVNYVISRNNSNDVDYCISDPKGNLKLRITDSSIIEQQSAMRQNIVYQVLP